MTLQRIIEVDVSYTVDKQIYLNGDNFLDVLDPFFRNATAIMQKRGIRQKDIAKHFGVTPGTVSAWFKRKSIPNLEQAMRLAEFLGVEFGDLGFDYSRIPRIDRNLPGASNIAQQSRYRLARELGYPIFKEEVE